jgi:hypothetical protein
MLASYLPLHRQSSTVWMLPTYLNSRREGRSAITISAFAESRCFGHSNVCTVQKTDFARKSGCVVPLDVLVNASFDWSST